MKLLDLFSGIGGFSYGLERIGFKTVAFCEMDKYCKLVLQKHWKGVKIYNDVKEITKERLEADGVELPEILTGGFPCQPFSIAGKQKGTNDDRHLWPEMFRIIKELKPKWIIGENVRGIVNIQDGMVFETVCTDLESEGYEVQAFNIPAAGVGAPHRRERIWIVANSRRTLRQGTELGKTNEDETKKEDADQHQRSSSPSKSDVANANSDRSTERRERQTIEKESYGGRSIERGSKINGRQRCVRETRQSERDDVANTISRDVETGRERQRGVRKESQGQGTSSDVTSSGETVANSGEGSWWHVEPDVGRVAHGVPGRVYRLKGLGNSIVPKIAEEIGKAIMKAEADDVRYQGGGAYKAMLKLFRDNLK